MNAKVGNVSIVKQKNQMKLLLEWDKPTKTSTRIFKRGSMKIDHLVGGISDIVLMRDDTVYRLIGKCRIISDDIGMWVDDIVYFVDENKLDLLLNSRRDPSRGTTELSLACYGSTNSDRVVDDAKFAFMTRNLFSGDLDCLDSIVRDLKLSLMV